MGDYINVPIGNGRYLMIAAVPSGWRYETGSSLAKMFNAGPVGVGSVDGTLVFQDTQGSYARSDQYRLRFDGWGVSLGVGASTPFSAQYSSEKMPSSARGQVYRLPRSNAPMGEAQEAGRPTGFAGQFLLLSYDRGVGGGKSTCFMFLGGSNALVSCLNQTELMQYKYALMFDGWWVGSTSGISGAVFQGRVHPLS